MGPKVCVRGVHGDDGDLRGAGMDFELMVQKPVRKMVTCPHGLYQNLSENWGQVKPELLAEYSSARSSGHYQRR